MSVLLNSPATSKSDTKRALLSARLSKAAEGAIPLSFAQQRLWFLDQLEPNSPLYNVPTVVKMSGTLRVDVLWQALEQIVTRHESLRTKFVDNDGNPTQIVDPDLHLDFKFTDLTDNTTGQAESAAHQRASASRCRERSCRCT